MFFFLFFFFSAGGLVCRRVDVSYFLRCTRKRDDVPFPRPTKEIRDVCTQARFSWNSRQTSLSKGFSCYFHDSTTEFYFRSTTPLLYPPCFELENLIVTQTIVLHNMANEGNEMSAMQLFQHIYPWNRHWYNLDQSELIES